MDFSSENNLDSNHTDQLKNLSEINKYTYFLEKPHKNLYCPVCFNLYKNPILVDCSHTLCNECIENDDEKGEKSSIEKLKKCPLDGKKITIKIFNKNIGEQIDDLPIRYIF